MKKILFFIFLLSCALKSPAQISYAVTGLYNFQANGIGLDGRVLLPLGNSIFIIPRVAYFPSFNDTHEYYAGIDITKYLFNFKGLNPYILLGGYYNNWINHDDFKHIDATQNNITLEPGVGILLYKGCLNPYIEARYSTKWKEYTAGIGIILQFSECFGGGKNKSPWKCPAYN